MEGGGAEAGEVGLILINHVAIDIALFIATTA